MSKGRRNVAFGNDEDFEIEFVSKETTMQDKKTQPQNEIIIDPIEDRDTGLISKMRENPGSRQEAIMGEITDFAKESPETIAAIIKGWFREDN